MTTAEYLRKKYGHQAIGDAREEDELAGMDPEELIAFPQAPAPLEDPPLVDAAEDVDEVALGREQDAEEGERVGYINASKKIASAISGGRYRADYVKAEGGNEDRAARRKQDLQTYLLAKNRGETNALNAKAAYNNSTRPKTATPAKPLNPLDDEVKRATIKQKEAAATKSLRIPAKKPEKAPKGPQLLPTSALSELSDIDTATSQLSRLDADFRQLQQSGVWAKVSARKADQLGEQDGPAAVYLAKARIAMQAVGKILEGGKLAAGDETKYREMLPKAGDSLSVLQSKIDGMKGFLSDMKTGRIKTYKSGGYRTPEEEGAPAKTGSLVKNASGRWVLQ